MNLRYGVRHETGGDYEIIDTHCKPPVARASGLSLDEAEETAARWNAEFQRETAGYI